MAGKIFYTMPEYASQLNEFNSMYEMREILRFPELRPPSLKPKSERVCRFCGLDASKTKFNKKPHIVPYFIGNKYGISDFECDSCNKRFSEYESHFANYLGLTQTFKGSSRKGVPTSKSVKNDIEARAMNLYGVDGIMIQKIGEDNDSIEWSEDEVVTITFTKASYIPLYVYKVLLKIALATLPIGEILAYTHAFDYLLSKVENDSTGVQNVAVYEFPINAGTPAPFGYLFQKRSREMQVPTHQFALYFQNKILTMALPYNYFDNQDGLYDRTPRDIPICPPLSQAKFANNIKHNFSVVNLSSKELLKGEEQILTFKVNIEQIKNVVHFDPATGEIREGELNRSDRKGIFLMPKGTVIKLENLKKP